MLGVKTADLTIVDLPIMLVPGENWGYQLMLNDSRSMIVTSLSRYCGGVIDMPEIPINFPEISKLYTNHFDVIRADTPALLDRVYEIRYQVYCLENAFEDPAQNLGGREIDADDDRAAHVLLIHRESGEAAGTARVI